MLLPLLLALAPLPAAAQLAEPPLFASHDPLRVTLRADFTQLRRDRRASPDRPATVEVEGSEVEIPAQVRTRGEFRLDPSNCSFPPLRIDFDGSDADGTVFEGQDDLKLVSSCRPGRSRYDELVRLEYLAYRAYQEVTDRAFRVRALEVTLVDTAGELEEATRFAFAIEDGDALADRLGGRVFELEEGRRLPPTAFEPTSAASAAVFNYMIGNVDWSAVAGHNVEIVDVGATGIAVPYDFDFSGLVDAPYAVPPPELGLRSVRDRMYRGWCANPLVTRSVLAWFRDAETGVLALARDMPGLSERTRSRAVRYLEEFFDDIATDDRAERQIFRHCRVPGR